MPPKASQTAKGSQTGKAKASLASQVTTSSNHTAVPAPVQLDALDNIDNLSAGELIRGLDVAQSEIHGRSIVIANLDEALGDTRPSERQKDLECKVSDILDVVNVECRPSAIYRMGTFDPARRRLVKVVLPTTTHWRLCLANARLLRGSRFSEVYIRKSMSPEERKRDFDLRQEARERNKGKAEREWVVYRGQLMHVSELPSRSSGNL